MDSLEHNLFNLNNSSKKLGKLICFLGISISFIFNTNGAWSAYSSQKLDTQTERTLSYDPPSKGSKAQTKFMASFAFGETDARDTYSIFNLGLRQGLSQSVDIGIEVPFISYLYSNRSTQVSEMGNPKVFAEFNVMKWSNSLKNGSLDIVTSATIPRNGKENLSHNRTDALAGLKAYQPLKEGFAGGDFSVTYRSPESGRSLGLLGQVGASAGWNLLPDLSIALGTRIRHARAGKLETGEILSPVSLATLEPEIRIAVLNSLVFHFVGYVPLNASNVKGRESSIGGIEVPGLFGPTLLIGTSMSF